MENKAKYMAEDAEIILGNTKIKGFTQKEHIDYSRKLIDDNELQELITLSNYVGRFLTPGEFQKITNVFDEMALRMIAECEGEE